MNMQKTIQSIIFQHLARQRSPLPRADYLARQVQVVLPVYLVRLLLIHLALLPLTKPPDLEVSEEKLNEKTYSP